MKIRDLPRNSTLRGVKFKLPTGEEVYWYSQWRGGIWYKKDMKEAQVYPFFIDELIEALEYEVVDSGEKQQRKLK